MLKVDYRLKKTKDFERVFKFGKSVSQDGLSFKFLNKTKNSSKRFGFIISSKIIKKANKRNQLRRKLQEITRKKMNLIKKNIDGVFIVRKDLSQQKSNNLSPLIDKLFKQFY